MSKNTKTKKLEIILRLYGTDWKEIKKASDIDLEVANQLLKSFYRIPFVVEMFFGGDGHENWVYLLVAAPTESEHFSTRMKFNAEDEKGNKKPIPFELMATKKTSMTMLHPRGGKP